MNMLKGKVNTLVKAMNDELTSENKQKIVDNIYKNANDKPCIGDLTVEIGSESKQKRAKNDRFIGIINKYIGI